MAYCVAVVWMRSDSSDSSTVMSSLVVELKSTLPSSVPEQGLNYISKLLLERGANPNIQNNEGNSALHFALSGKNFIIADLLKKFGAKEDCYNKLGYTPWDCVGKSIEII